MQVTKARARGLQRGQSTVEFMLMIPVIFSIFFFVIEMSLYFSAVHYTNYAAYVTARSRVGNYGVSPDKGIPDRADKIAELVLTGSVFKNNTNVSETSRGVDIGVKHWRTNFPYLSALLPNMPFQTHVNLGPSDYTYENKTNPKCTDNDVKSYFSPSTTGC